MRTTWPALALLLLASACDKARDEKAPEKTNEPPAAKADEPAKDEPPKPEPEAPAAKLEAGTAKLEHESGNVEVDLRLPIGWVRAETSDGGIRVDDPSEMGDGVLSFSAGCESPCDGTKLTAEVDALVAGYADEWAKPNSGTGDPALDEVRLEVKIIEQGDLPQGGKFVYASVNIPRNEKLGGPYRSEWVASCWHHREGDLAYVRTSFRLNSQWPDAQTWLPLLVEACKATTRK
jgi:hypothetical protein